ncbi:M56 family metallopeptidase [Embleya sp. NPDC055664]
MSSLAVWAALLGAAIVLPHLAPLDRVRPVGAAAVWASALAARAAVAIGLVLTAVICLPDTPRFAHWVRELPHQVVTGVGDTELALGGLAFLTLAAVAHRLRTCLRDARTPLHPLPLTGPGGSIVVGDREVLMAAVGRRQRSIVVSAGALAALDDDELAAGLAHELGHISRAHHWWQAGAEVCRLLARCLPGTARAADELAFQLERAADVWAIEHGHDPVVLASAVCKAALAGPIREPDPSGGAHHLIGRSPTYAGRRVRLLLEGCPTGTHRRNLAVRASALAMTVLITGATLTGTTHFGTTLLRCHITTTCPHPIQSAHR